VVELNSLTDIGVPPQEQPTTRTTKRKKSKLSPDLNEVTTDSGSTSNSESSHESRSKSKSGSGSESGSGSSTGSGSGSSSSSSSTSSEGVIPEPAVFQITMNDGMGHTSEHNITTLPRVGVFMAYSKIKTPLAFEMFLDRVAGVPQTVIFLKVNKANIPSVVEKDRIRVRMCFESVYFVNVNFGYAEHTESNSIIEILTKPNTDLPPMNAQDITFFVPADTIRVTRNNPFWKVLLFLYSAMKSVFFGSHRLKLPPHNTIYIATVAELGDPWRKNTKSFLSFFSCCISDPEPEGSNK